MKRFCMQTFALFVLSSSAASLLALNGTMIDRFDYASPPMPMRTFFTGLFFSSVYTGLLGVFLTLFSLLLYIEPSNNALGDTQE